MIRINAFTLVLLLFLATESVSGQSYPKDYFRAPLDIPLILSGTFGELRSNHFHSGIDIKTQQRTGLPVLAVADGTVVRIKVSPFGFGKAVYLRHPNGYTSVYAHLQEFEPALQKYVRDNQYSSESFAIELYPPAGQFEFKAGELIAKSGNSGGSGAPHLHFEIRDTRTEEIINPLFFGFEVKDTRPPDLYDLEVYEFDKDELISNYSLDLIRLEPGKYALAGDEVISVSNLPAFGLRTTDRLDGANNRNGIYSIEMKIAGISVYNFVMERFAFAETRYINSHIDFGQKKCCKRTINRLYLEPNNKFSAYRHTSSMQLPDLIPDSLYDVEIAVLDIMGNSSVLNFKLERSRPNKASLTENTELPFSVFPYDQSNYYKNEHLEFVLPEGALYRNVNFFYKKSQACNDCYSFIHTLASEEIPVHKYYKLKIKPDAQFEGDPGQLVIMSMKDGKPVDYEGGAWDGKYVVARTRQFGDFAIMADSKAPQAITGNFVDGGRVSRKSGLKIIVKDEVSGIDTYRATIDGNWHLFDFDAKNHLLFHDLEASGLDNGEHVLEVVLTDKSGNESRHNYHFILY